MRGPHATYTDLCVLICALIACGASSLGQCWALEPVEILVLANRNASSSIGLAKHYMQTRGIPEENLVRLWVTDEEWCSRKEYEKKVLEPLRKFIREHPARKRIRCVVTVYGIPLKVLPPETGKIGREDLAKLGREREALGERLARIKDHESNEAESLKKSLERVEAEISRVDKTELGASLDSEIALVLKQEYPLAGWTPNPLFVGHQGRFVEGMPDKGEVLMVSRLDGADPAIVRRIVDDSMQTERKGLEGVAYFDAQGSDPRKTEEGKPGKSYGRYDHSLHLAAERVQRSGRMPVVVNDKPELFQPGDCPNAALYCGWYSLARYVDAFQWRAGSVGYHIASGEAQWLRQPGSQVWCKRMLEKGIAATLGPVNEPYLHAFPLPELFFGLLLEGYYSLAEIYALSQPFWSWQMVLIGDPLYRPFRQPLSK
jgi:uncharacterized protein (TIGR03790 family)